MEIKYPINGQARPHASFMQRLLLKLFSCTFLHRYKIVKLTFCKLWGLPVNTSISRGFYCSAPLLTVGENVGLGNTFIRASAPVTIGRGCSLSYNNTILTGTHDLSCFSTVIAKPVIIGDNVWITTNVTILPGVTIGNNTVIGAGSVVTKDIPSDVFAAGNPCIVIRKINFIK